MRVVVIENTVYNITEKQFKQLKKVQDDTLKHGYRPDNEMIIADYLDEHKHEYRLVGEVEFDFRL